MIIHKRDPKAFGLNAPLCSHGFSFLLGTRVSKFWKDVTCKKCLELKRPRR